jgi:hypothetical protein
MSIPELAWTDTDVLPGKTYHYVVSGVNGTGESGNSDEVIVTMPGTDPAPPPSPAPAADATAAAPSNGNGDYPKEPPVPEEKPTPAPEANPS